MVTLQRYLRLASCRSKKGGGKSPAAKVFWQARLNHNAIKVRPVHDIKHGSYLSFGGGSWPPEDAVD
jgi:hypothetical protein